MMEKINLSSPKQLSLLLFGGVIKERGTEPCLDEQGNFIRIKSGLNKGQIKTRNIEILKEFKGLGLSPQPEWKKNTGYSTDENVLNILASYKEENDAVQIAKLLLKSRELNKLISTYYNSVEELTYPDDRIHPKFNHVQTETGRLSSNHPNVQNIPK